MVHVLQNHKSDTQSVSCIDMLELKHTVVLSTDADVTLQNIFLRQSQDD